MTRCAAAVGFLLVLFTLPACNAQPHYGFDDPRVRVLSDEDLGAAQGVFEHRGLYYALGDTYVRGRRGVIREYRREGDTVAFTGRQIVLTVDGEDFAPHPTGLTWHPEFGCFLGDTVNQTGIIHHIDWDRALADGDLDNAVLHTVLDDEGVNGTRPEFVEYRGRWLLATSDYGPEGNEIRLYDPERLLEVIRTSAPDVVVARWDCGPFVQSLCWLPADPWAASDRSESPAGGVLVLVQNREPGLLYRLTFVDLEADARLIRRLDLEQPRDELEGAEWLGDRLWLLVSANRARAENIVLVELGPDGSDRASDR
jgi:hypothetical protein